MSGSGRHGLDEVASVEVPTRVLRGTQEDLREIGNDDVEGFALWVGTVDGATARVHGIVIPPQQPIKDETGVGYLVTSATLFALNKFLNEKRLRLLAQIHTHPTEAYHSAMDDKYAIVTTEGGFSLVIPDFARGEPDITTWACYRLQRARWCRLDKRAVHTTFKIG